MNVQQYLTLKQQDFNDNYLPMDAPNVTEGQIKALYKALTEYMDSDCVDQNASQIEKVKQILNHDNKNVRIFVHNVLYAVVYDYLSAVLPVNGKYQYNAGICKGACGYGTNRVVALVGQQLIKTNLDIEDIMQYPQQMMIEFWGAFKSLTERQQLGTGINYNFKGKVCPVKK